MSLKRRDFLARAAALGVLFTLPVIGCSDDSGSDTDSGSGGTAGDGDGDGLPTYEYDGPTGDAATFEHGVASGDPLADSVILWTRVSLGSLAGEIGDAAVDVFLEVSRDRDFTQRVAAEYLQTSGDRDHTVKVDAAELESGTTYYFRFSALGVTSKTGRTKTAADGSPERLRLGVVSCSNFAYGYFHAYRHLGNRPDLDAVVHLGDYIYEYENGGYGTLRECEPPTEIVSLADYRLRYSQYRRDADLQFVHQQNPFICIWDDHEYTNDPTEGGAENHQPDQEGDWNERKAVALQAFSEWIPCRVDAGVDVYRTLMFGDLVQLTLADRLHGYLYPEEGADTWSSFGDTQATWLQGQIEGATATWLLLGSQSLFNSLGTLYGGWDGAEQVVYDALKVTETRNFVSIGGDIHNFGALAVRDDDVDVGVEFICGSVTSPGVGFLSTLQNTVYGEAEERGYLLLTFTPTRMAADFWTFPDAQKNSPSLPAEGLGASFEVMEGANVLVAKTEPEPTFDDAPPVVPE